MAAGTAALDIWSKALWDYPKEGGGAPLPVKVLIDGWLAIRTVWNQGGVWSLPIPGWILTGATTLAVPLVTLWLLWPARAHRWDNAGKALILGGAAGNCWDRLCTEFLWLAGGSAHAFHGVRDWIDVTLWGWHYPTFNVADAALVVGIGILLVRSFRAPHKEEAR